MESFKDVFLDLNQLVRDGVIQSYAIAGATAFLFYSEPVLTYDLDVFIFLPPQAGLLVSMQPLYDELSKRGYSFDAEHVMMHGTPVQFLPAYNPLAIDSVDHAVDHDYEGVPVRVVSPEHLVALALQTGGEHRRGRARALIAAGGLDMDRLNKLCQAHGVELGDQNG
jgi:hypothetical protein